MENAVNRVLDGVGLGVSWEAMGKLLAQTKEQLPFCDGAKLKSTMDKVLTSRFGPPKGKEQKQQKPTDKSSSQNKERPKIVSAKLPAIDLDMSNLALAEQLYRMAKETSGDLDMHHAVEMIADTIAAIQRKSYAAGLASGNVDPRNGVRLPGRQ